MGFKSSETGLVLRLSTAQLISWGSIFYMFSVVLEPLEHDLGLSRAEVSVALVWRCLPRV